MAVEKVPLFSRPREWILFVLVLLLLFGANLLYRYHTYVNFTAEPFRHLDATVLSQYQKQNRHHKPYTVLKLHSGDLTFYTTTKEDLKPLKNRILSLTLVTKNIPFYRYLGTFYAPTFNISLLPRKASFKVSTLTYITGQHTDPAMEELFAALFLAQPPGKMLREDISDIGVSHLIALSGYHLGFLGGILLLLLRFPYAFLQQRFFPYRNRTFDLAALSALLLFGYMLFAGSPPSLLRAYGMLLVGLVLFSRWIDLFSFATLFVTLGLLIALIPGLLFSVGFWFSAAGVFYIYLFLHYFRHWHPVKILLALNLFIFAAMLPVVHFIFTKFTLYQLLSPILSLLFALFYPLEIILHLFGMGNILDTFLTPLLHMEMTRFTLPVSLPFLIFYLLLSFATIFSHRFFRLYLIALGSFVAIVPLQIF